MIKQNGRAQAGRNTGCCASGNYTRGLGKDGREVAVTAVKGNRSGVVEWTYAVDGKVSQHKTDMQVWRRLVSRGIEYGTDFRAANTVLTNK